MNDALTILKEKSAPSQKRMDALLLIMEVFEENYFPILEEILCDKEEDTDIRSAVALSLGKLNDQRSFDVLKTCYEDSDTIVRRYVIEALAMTHKEEAAPLLVEALKDESNDVFAGASEGLCSMGKKATPYLIDTLDRGANDAKCIAAWCLGESGDNRSIPRLLETLKHSDSADVRALCIWALGEIGTYDDELVNMLSELKGHPNPDIKLRADTALSKIVRHVN